MMNVNAQREIKGLPFLHGLPEENVCLKLAVSPAMRYHSAADGSGRMEYDAAEHFRRHTVGTNRRLFARSANGAASARLERRIRR